LQKGYNKIIKTLNINTEVLIKYIPFEDADIQSNAYDIALTSPPYFDLEKYGNDSNQSIIKYSSYNDWLSNFYYIYIIKMINAIKPGGYVVIYIEDVTSNGIRYNIREFTIKTINDSNMMINHTKFGLKIGKAIRYALIWQKK